MRLGIGRGPNIKPLVESDEVEVQVTSRVPRRSEDGAGESFADIEEALAQQLNHIGRGTTSRLLADYGSHGEALHAEGKAVFFERMEILIQQMRQLCPQARLAGLSACKATLPGSAASICLATITSPNASGRQASPLIPRTRRKEPPRSSGHEAQKPASATTSAAWTTQACGAGRSPSAAA